MYQSLNITELRKLGAKRDLNWILTDEDRWLIPVCPVGFWCQVASLLVSSKVVSYSPGVIGGPQNKQESPAV